MARRSLLASKTLVRAKIRVVIRGASAARKAIRASTCCRYVDSPPTRSSPCRKRVYQATAFQHPRRSDMRVLSMIRVAENTGNVPSEQLQTDMGKLIEE